jgi:hypothetical protein
MEQAVGSCATDIARRLLAACQSAITLRVRLGMSAPVFETRNNKLVGWFPGAVAELISSLVGVIPQYLIHFQSEVSARWMACRL